MSEPSVVICWSRSRSLAIAKRLEEELPKIDPAFLPWTSDSIEKGTLWFDELHKRLKSAKVGLYIITPENNGTAWINYEAGYLHRAGVVGFGLVFALPKTAVQGPMAQFQVTETTGRDLKRFLEDLAATLGVKIEIGDTHVERLMSVFDKVPLAPLGELFPDLESLFRRKTFEEPIDECLSADWLHRYGGSRETLALLRAHRGAIVAGAPAHVVQSFDDLVSAIDSYADAMGGRLLTSRPKDTLRDDGGLALEPALVSALERRRAEVHAHLQRVVAPWPTPVRREALQYQRYADVPDQGIHVLRQLDLELETNPELLSEEQLAACQQSPWELDRAVFYLSLAYRKGNTDLAERLQQIQSALIRDFEGIDLLAPDGDVRAAAVGLWALNELLRKAESGIVEALTKDARRITTWTKKLADEYSCHQKKSRLLRDRQAQLEDTLR